MGATVISNLIWFHAVFIFANTCIVQANSFPLAWPTPNPSFAQGLGYHAYLQKTGPDKEFSSGAFGCVRNHGKKFHEGVDLFPIRSNSLGEAEDSIFAALPGTVAYLCQSSNQSAYGKYIVLEHRKFSPVMYTLYAHLNEISKDLRVNDSVDIAQAIGKMGNSASFRIPLERSHLHFEIGLRLSDNFDKWYQRQLFKTKNMHHNFNGYNLVGIDPLLFYSVYQKTPFTSPSNYLKTLPVVTKVQVRHSTTPYLARSNPSMILNPDSREPVNSWICSFGPFGFPLKFEKSSAKPAQQVRVLSYDEKNDSKFCRKLITRRNGMLIPSEQLGVYLELIFLD